jgi:hypothetical protein
MTVSIRRSRQIMPSLNVNKTEKRYNKRPVWDPTLFPAANGLTRKATSQPEPPHARAFL